MGKVGMCGQAGSILQEVGGGWEVKSSERGTWKGQLREGVHQEGDRCYTTRAVRVVSGLLVCG